MSKGATTKYRRIKGRLYAAGFSIRSWAVANGYAASTVYDAAKGNRHGVKAHEIRQRLQEMQEVSND